MCICGAIFPDVPTALQAISDKLHNRPLFSAEEDPYFEETLWFRLKDMSHSPLVWFIPWIVAFTISLPLMIRKILAVFSIGVASHWILDVFTHCGKEFKESDQSLLWPFHSHRAGKIPKLGYLVGKYFWGWEYRYNYKQGGDLRKTKHAEQYYRIILILECCILLYARL